MPVITSFLELYSDVTRQNRPSAQNDNKSATCVICEKPAWESADKPLLSLKVGWYCVCWRQLICTQIALRIIFLLGFQHYSAVLVSESCSWWGRMPQRNLGQWVSSSIGDSVSFRAALHPTWCSMRDWAFSSSAPGTHLQLAALLQVIPLYCL